MLNPANVNSLTIEGSLTNLRLSKLELHVEKHTAAILNGSEHGARQCAPGVIVRSSGAISRY